MVVRLVETGGTPQHNVNVSFASAIASAREMNGQEEAVSGETLVADGALMLISFG